MIDDINNGVGGDLIAKKTAEYDNLPGLILGLDGWILRSIPKEYRVQFFNFYEKAVRVAFAPDRQPTEALKQSRTIFLQSFSEALHYILSDDFAFEAATDTVPTRHNPVLTLRRALDVRDSIIAKTDARDSESRLALKQVQEQLQLVTEALARHKKMAENRDMLHYRIRRFIHATATQLPVPVRFELTTVRGSYIRFKPSSSVFTTLKNYSGENDLSVESPIIRKNQWAKQLRKSGLLDPSKVFHFRRGHSIKTSHRAILLGGMTLAHLCEYIRNRTGYLKTPTNDDVWNALVELQNPAPREDLYTLPYRARMEPFFLPFYGKDMMLLIQNGSAHYKLLLVDEVDAGKGHHQALAANYRNKAKEAEHRVQLTKKEMVVLGREKRQQETINHGLDKELKKVRENLVDMHEIQRRNKDLKTRNLELREEVKQLTLRLERMRGQVALEKQTQEENVKLKKKVDALQKKVDKSKDQPPVVVN